MKRDYVLFLSCMAGIAACGDDEKTNQSPTGQHLIVSATQSSGCLENTLQEGASPVAITTDCGALTVTDSAAELNCCATPVMSAALDINGDVTIIETEQFDEETCLCVCSFELSVLIESVPAGEHVVRVYRRAVSEDTLVHEEAVTVPECL